MILCLSTLSVGYRFHFLSGCAVVILCYSVFRHIDSNRQDTNHCLLKLEVHFKAHLKTKPRVSPPTELEGGFKKVFASSLDSQ